MKSCKLFSASVMALAALAASSTFADGLTREQVRAEYFAAKAAGTLPVCSECDVHNPQKVVITSASTSATPRASVQARAPQQAINERAASDWQPNSVGSDNRQPPGYGQGSGRGTDNWQPPTIIWQPN